MSAKFSFAVDRSLGLIEIAMRGVFTLEDVAAFLDARWAAHRALGWPANRHLTLNDLSELRQQPREIVMAFQAILGDPEFKSRKLAFVVGEAPVRSQLTRALLSRDAICFSDRDSARAWLLSHAT